MHFDFRKKLYSAMMLTIGSCACSLAAVVINEIHYDPADKTSFEEFIELYNTTDSAVDLSGWSLRDAVEYVFPPGSTIASNGYLVVAQDPTVIDSVYGVAALGPWVGRLSNDGEDIELFDDSETRVDRVQYKLGFPWPTVGDAPGYSIELINPAFDNDLGGNWRRSFKDDLLGASVTLFPTNSSWKYFKGTSEASSPTAAWRAAEFDDTAWLSGKAPIGYGEPGHVSSNLSDMQGNYSGIYLRKTFMVDDPESATALQLAASYDDGFKLWINATNVLNENISDGTWNKEMLTGFIGSYSGGFPAQSYVTLSQIPYAAYDIYVYFSSDVAGRTGTVTDGTTTYYFQTIGPASVSGADALLVQATDTSTAGYSVAANYAVFTNLTGTSQIITSDIPEWGGIAAIQIARSAPASPTVAISYNFDTYGTIGGSGAGSGPVVGATAGVVPVDHWYNDWPFYPTANLADSDGNPTTMDIGWGYVGTYAIQFSHLGADSEVPITGTADSDREDLSYIIFTIDNPADILVQGTNIVAVQAHNVSLGGSDDFWFDARLSMQATPHGPTPGTRNSVYATNTPPQIRQVDHSPNQPMEDETVVVTAKITDPEGVAGVSLDYQIVDPGVYIAIDDSAYDTNWTTIPMTDDGTGGDELAGDSIYTATLPESIQQNRRLLRYRISATDSLAASVTVPYADDPQPNFAYFCYNGVPAWQASVQPGTTPMIDFGTNIMRRLPSVHLISKNTDVENATWFDRWPDGDPYNWNGTLVYDGKVYDHIRYRSRGGIWRYAMVKNMWKFDFNRGHDFQMRDDYGKKYDVKWTKLNLGACIQQRQFYHRGEQGMFESVGSRLFNLAGVPSFNTAFLQFRIIDAAEEATTDQYEGDFWGLYLAVEQLNGRFLDEHGLPDGNFYKMDAEEYGDGGLNNLGPYGPTDKSDLHYILNNYTGASDAWWEENWNLEDYYSYQTIIQAIHHYDINAGKNFFYYRHPETGIWSVIPFDLDLTWANNMYNPPWGGMNPLADRILSASASGNNLYLPGSTRTEFRTDFRNRIREIRDLLFNADQTGQLIDEKSGLLRDTGVSPSFLDADQAMWDYNPKMINSVYFETPIGVWQALNGYFYLWPQEPVTKDFEGCVQLMKNYVDERGSILDALAADSEIPNKPAVSYAGVAGYPLNGLSFACSSFSDPQGNGTFGAMQWRAGEVLDVTAPAYDPLEEPPYEIETIWESGVLTNFSDSITIPANALKVGHAYRVRVHMQDDTGRWSHWSDPVEFIAAESSTAGAMASYLRISEVMYDPPAGPDFEYIELHNISTNLSLDLSGAAFTSGIDFNFPDGSMIEPNGYTLLIGTTNEAAFRAHYGLPLSVAIASAYEGNIANEGEQITLKTAPGGTAIASFEYNNSRLWPLAAAGAGHSLVPLRITGQATGALDYPGNWRASAYIGGSPGAEDPSPPQATVVLNEIIAHTDTGLDPPFESNDKIELYNPTTADIALTNWYLSDSSDEPGKWAIPIGTVVPAMGFIVFDEDDFHPGRVSGFGLDKAGEQLLLSYLPGSASDRVDDAIGFKGQESGRSLGRIDDYWYATGLSPGTVNIAPFDGLRIGEIMYYPVPTETNDNTHDEFIEIYNPTDSNVIMQTVDEPWRIDGGVEYTFPDNTTVPAGSTLLVVGFDPADTVASNAFAAAYSLSHSVVMFGPWSGKLGNRSERVALERPQVPDFVGDNYSWVVEDETVYGNQQPWPTSTAGQGNSLVRVLYAQSGLDPYNWMAASPTPGASFANPLADRDGDGMSDYEEWVSGTDPDDPNSVFRLKWSGGTTLAWEPLSGRIYSIYWTDNLTLPFVPIATSILPPQSNYIDTAYSTNSAGFYLIGVDLE